MGRKALELTGRRFGRLIAIERMGLDKWGNIFWLCQCDCGNITEIRVHSLVRGDSQSCGCLNAEITRKRLLKHGHAVNGMMSRTYKSWRGFHQRCNNPKDPCYKHYGGRGITVCKRWSKFENFLADMGKCPEGLTIERKDNDGNYEPGNCVWATLKEQNRNTRRAKLTALKVQVIKKLLQESKLKTHEIAEIFNVKTPTIYDIKVERNWSDINYIGQRRTVNE